MNKSDYNLFRGYKSKWTFFPEAGLPTLVLCRAMPIGTVFYDTEMEAIDFKLIALSKIQSGLRRRKSHLEYKQQEKQYEDAEILPKTT